MQSGQFEFQGNNIAYSYFGSGAECWVALHGYGETGSSFGILEPFMSPGRGLLAIDLPFHGQSVWNGQTPFTPDALQHILDRLIERHFPDARSFHLAGFSMGGRLALSLLQQFPNRYRKVVLLAPDGLRENPWYRLATQTRAGNLLFRFTMNHPGWFRLMLQLGNKWHMVNPGIFKFTMYYINNADIRRQLYQRWTGMRHFRPNLRKIKSEIPRYHHMLKLVYGRHDRIIVSERSGEFREGIQPYCSLLILDCGHQVLHPDNAAVLVKTMQS